MKLVKLLEEFLNEGMDLLQINDISKLSPGEKEDLMLQIDKLIDEIDSKPNHPRKRDRYALVNKWKQLSGDKY